MANTINLANVNISIQQFQDVSNGKFNAGEVLLTSETTLDKVNDHVRVKSWNNVARSHHEVLAVKTAFARALMDNGVGEEAIARVRRELGLAPEGAVDTSLADRSVRPLTRQQVRTILDRYANTINTHNHAQIIVTYDELHDRYGEAERAEIVRTRNQVNAELMKRRPLLRDQRIVDIQNVIAGAVHFVTDAERQRLVTAALRQRECIMNRSHGHPSNEPNATLEYPIPETGQTLTLSLGMSEADYVRKLDDMLAMMRGVNRTVSGDAMAVRAQFKSVALSGPEAISQWIGGLANDPNGAFKARTIAVGLLFDGGIDDWETLSLVNKVTDEAAIALVSGLVANDVQRLRGDALRQSQPVAALAGQIAPQPVPDGRKAFIPALSPREANTLAHDALIGYGRELSHDMKTMADEVMAELRARFGAEAVPEGKRFSAIVAQDVMRSALGPGDVRRPIADVKAAVLAGAAPDVARRCIAAVVKPMLATAGAEAGVETAVASSILTRTPALRNLLVAAASPDEVRALIEDFRADIEAGVRRQAAIDKGRAAARTWYREEIAEAMGVPAASLEDVAVLSVQRINNKGVSLGTEIANGTNEADTDEEIVRAYRGFAHQLAQERISLLRQADEMEIAPAARDIVKGMILTFNKVSDLDLVQLRYAADGVQVAALADALVNGAGSDEVIGKMAEVARRAGEVAGLFIGEQAGMVGEADTAFKLILVLALAKRPEMFDTMRSFFMRPEIADRNFAEMEGAALQATAFNIFKPEQSVKALNAELANTLGKPVMKPLVAQAFNQALADLGLGGMSLAERAKLLGGNSMRTLANLVRNASKPVTPSLLRALVRTAFAADAVEAHVGRLVSMLAEMDGYALSQVSLKQVRDVLSKRFPGILAKMKTAVSHEATFGGDPLAAVDKLFTPHVGVALATVRAFHEIEEASTAATDTVVREIAERANLEEALVREKLDLSGLLLDLGGSLAFLKSDVRDELARPETDPDAYSIQAVAQRAAQAVEKFIARKVGFIAEIDAMNVSDQAKGNLIVRVLEQQSYKDASHAQIAARVIASHDVQIAFAAMKQAFAPERIAVMQDEDLFRTLEFFTRNMNAAMDHEISDEQRAGMDIGDIEIIRQLVTFAMMDFCGDTLKAAAEVLARDGRFDGIAAAGSAITETYNAQYLNAVAPMPVPGQPAPKPNPAAGVAAERALSNARAASNVLAFVKQALYDDWLPEDIATRFHREDHDVDARAHAAVKYAPSAFTRYAEGLDEGRRAELRAFVISLDWQDGVRAASEAAVKAKAALLRVAGAGFTTEGSPAAARALEMGYARGELQTLQRVADIYREATGCGAAESYVAALDPASDARRLFAFGGRFTASAENFRKGLALIGKFKAWFAEVNAQLAPVRNNGGNVPDGASLTVLNADTHYLRQDAEYAYEKFLFEHLAVTDALPLEAADPKTIFDMEANPVTRFFGRGYSNSATNTMAQVPPEQRVVIYDVFDMIAPLATTPNGVLENRSFSAELLGRILLHLDEISEMRAAGTLTKESICNRFLTDIPGAPGMTMKQMSDFVNNKIYYEYFPNQLGGNIAAMSQFGLMLIASGCTLGEVLSALVEHRSLSSARYVAAGNDAIHNMDGSAKGGRKQALMDLRRPAGPSRISNGTQVLELDNVVFTAVFPDGTTLRAENDDGAKAIADKVEELCGGIHQVQLNSVFLALTQAASTPVVGVFTAQDIATQEHMALTYTFEKNVETGVVTIRYSEPVGFPVHFHWETTVAVDGTTASTQMVVE